MNTAHCMQMVVRKSPTVGSSEGETSRVPCACVLGIQTDRDLCCSRDC